MVGDEMAEGGEVGGYADATGEEEDGAVGGERGGMAVGAFKEGGEGVARFEGAVVEVGCEAGAAAEDEGDCVLGGEGRRGGIGLAFRVVCGGVFQVLLVGWEFRVG